MVNILVTALLIGLGVNKLVDFVEELAPWVIRDLTKVALTIVLSGALSAALSDTLLSKTQFLTTLGAFGIASISHAVDSGLRAWKDSRKVEVMTKMTRGRSRL